MNWVQGISIVGLILATLYLGYVPEQSDFYKILPAASIGFASYFFLIKNKLSGIKLVFWIGFFVRAALLFSFPNLSDDIYRFIWDGELTAQGLNPYGYLPSELVKAQHPGLSMELFDRMNSPDYYTIYPPLTQLIFYISTWFNDSIFVSSFIIKAIFLVAEIFTFRGILAILNALNLDERLSAIYFLNPLIIVEGIGNLHFEIIMIPFLIWSLYHIFVKSNLFLGALLFALSIATKLLPLMFLPFFLFGLESKARLRFFLFGFGFTVLAFLPIAFGLDLQNFASSIDLYFQKFEFNGSIYYVLRYLGKLISGYNLIFYIGPILGLISLGLIVRKAYLQHSYSLASFIEFAFYSFVVYLFLATTIHPWYLCIPILLSVFVRWRFALLWSLLILFTYINYMNPVYAENLGIVALEYVLVFGCLIYEHKTSQSTGIEATSD